MMMSKISTERDFNWKKSVNIYNVTENDHGNKSNKKGKEGRIRIKIILDDGGGHARMAVFLHSTPLS